MNIVARHVAAAGLVLGALIPPPASATAAYSAELATQGNVVQTVQYRRYGYRPYFGHRYYGGFYGRRHYGYRTQFYGLGYYGRQYRYGYRY